MDLDDLLVELIEKIDNKRDRVAEEAKKSYQYKSSKKYKQSDLIYLKSLLDKRNILVAIVNYIRTNDEEYLNKIYKED